MQRINIHAIKNYFTLGFNIVCCIEYILLSQSIIIIYPDLQIDGAYQIQHKQRSPFKNWWDDWQSEIDE